ncbi:MAG: triose-phosphate isomerase [Planctomycetes bacterium]|nr:triose-phosphate isomerase [Planctomycetota bacterium]
MRKRFVAGNWKMNLERRSALALCAALKDGVGAKSGASVAVQSTVRVAVAPPFVYLAEVVRALEGSVISVGAQDVGDRVSGAFTGEVSAAMLKDVGAHFAIVGHSERRHVYGEGDVLTNQKLLRTLEAGLEVILCVGETLAERQGKQTESVVARQLTKGLASVARADLARVTLAYEPVWAIGTGQNATPEQASQVHQYLRGVLSGLYDEGAAEGLTIQYGGSVAANNAAAILGAPDVDGALVGGASLKAETFLSILAAGTLVPR